MGADTGPVKILLLRLDAPLMSFGGPSVDQHGVMQAFPGLSMLTGLIANALGWTHRDFEQLDRLQERMVYAVRTDRRGEQLIDYQTVDLGSEWMRSEASGWTTRGRIAARKGASGDTTHQRYRHYLADSLHTVALRLKGDEPPSLDAIAEGLRQPARPLFIGRKCCLPAAPMLEGVLEGESLFGVLASRPRMARADRGSLQVWWWEGDDGTESSADWQLVAVTDERHWRNRVHVGRRFIRQGFVNPPEASGG